MKARLLVSLFALAMLAMGCNASKPELNKDDQAQMDKLFREGIKPNSGGAGGGATPASGNAPKPMNQDAG